MQTYLSNLSEDFRPKAVLPKHNLGLKEKNNEVFKEDPPPRPTSAMSDAFQAPTADAYRDALHVLLKHFSSDYNEHFDVQRTKALVSEFHTPDTTGLITCPLSTKLISARFLMVYFFITVRNGDQSQSFHRLHSRLKER